jgi:hypothetical protein
MAEPTTLLTGRHPRQGTLYAAIAPNAHHVEPEVGASRLLAHLRPFTSEDAARSALVAAGAVVEGGVR